MVSDSSSGLFSNWKNDLPASIVVFFVALPLCLGIAVASDAPPFAGLIAGIIGGIMVGAASGSKIGVSGPAAGLAAIVATAIADLGYANFLMAAVIGGGLQILFGVLKAGVIGYYFPSSVIKGMLTGIGIIIILKMLPRFFGIDADAFGDLYFNQVDGENTFTEIGNIISGVDVSATTIGLISMAILLLWSNVLVHKGKIFSLIQGPLVAVVVGILYYIFTKDNSTFSLAPEHLVNVPVPDNFDDFIGQFSFPSLSALGMWKVWLTGFTIALVASLETLLCVEATDKLDPDKRITPTNRELLAQGAGNILSGLIGGLPITQVIVRSSANIQSGGRTKLSAIVHGFLLLISVLTIPSLLNKIPFAVLAAVLLVVGYKLAKPATFSALYKAGWQQFVPFLITVIGIVVTNLLAGIAIGLAVAVVIILYRSYQNSHFLHIVEDAPNHKVKMRLAEEVTFFNKGAILKELNELPYGTELEIDVRKTRYLDYDVMEILQNFSDQTEDRDISFCIISEKGEVQNPDSIYEFFNLAPAAGH